MHRIGHRRRQHSSVRSRRQYDQCHGHPVQRFRDGRGHIQRRNDGGLRRHGCNLRAARDRQSMQWNGYGRRKRCDLHDHDDEQLRDPDDSYNRSPLAGQVGQSWRFWSDRADRISPGSRGVDRPANNRRCIRFRTLGRTTDRVGRCISLTRHQLPVRRRARICRGGCCFDSCRSPPPDSLP